MKSLRVRLLIGTLFWIFLSLVVAGFGLGRLFHEHVRHQLEMELRTHLDQLTAALEMDEPLHLRNIPSDPRFFRPLSGLYWQIERRPELLRSRSLWDQKLDLNQAHPHLTLIKSALGTPLLALVRKVRVQEQDITLAVAIDASALRDPVQRFNRELWQSLLILGIGLVIAAVVQLWLGLRPLKRLQKDLLAIRQGQSTQLSQSYPTELTPLVSEFNAVLKHHQESSERARTQAGNLAHALKTPLSILANAAACETSAFAQLVGTQTAQARAQVDYHLSRAQAAATRRLNSRCEVRPVLLGLIRTLNKLYSDKTLDFHLECEAGLCFQGEEPELQEMLGNLLDNACKWAKGRIAIQVWQEQKALHIVIEDDGAGVPEAQFAQILQRGVRADERVLGSGLGLNIVSDLANEYAGQVQLLRAKLGGLAVWLSLPAA